MAERTVCFRSNAGNDFPTEYDAWKDDLRHYILSVIANEKLARDLADHMCANLKPEYGVAPGPGLVLPIIFDGIAHIIGKLNDLHKDTPPQLDLRPARVVTLSDIHGDIAGITPIGPQPMRANSVVISHVEPSAVDAACLIADPTPPPYAPGAPGL